MHRLERIGSHLAGLIGKPTRKEGNRRAFEKFKELLARQGVLESYIAALTKRDEPDELLRCKEAAEGFVVRKAQVRADCDGTLIAVDMAVVDRVLDLLTDGENRYVGGFRILKDVGEDVSKDEVLAEAYSRSYGLAQQAVNVLGRSAFKIDGVEQSEPLRSEYISKYRSANDVNVILDQFERPVLGLASSAPS